MKFKIQAIAAMAFAATLAAAQPASAAGGAILSAIISGVARGALEGLLAGRQTMEPDRPAIYRYAHAQAIAARLPEQRQRQSGVPLYNTPD